ncbi:unnamed protein product, partial [marine sediment metagenome]
VSNMKNLMERSAEPKAVEISDGFVANVYKERRDIYDRAFAMRKELGLGGLWKGESVAMDIIITHLLELEGGK